MAQWTQDDPQVAEALSASAAAAALGVSQRTIRRAIARGELPAVKRAGIYRIRPADAARYGERRRLRPHVAAPPPISFARRDDEPPVHAVPHLRTPLIGRERELALLRNLIGRDDVPLITLTGPGGVGKTRLALALAGSMASTFPDGVRFVALASIRDPELVLPTIARVLGLPEDAAQSSAARLISALRARRLLLVLDNLEQALGAAPMLAEVLAACPNLRVLATSRAPLRLSEEREVPVAPLAVPTESELALVAAAPAVQLFVARAHAVDPAFVLTAGNAASVAAICARLDGLPLAIELAAARTTLFTPEALLPQLARRLQLLTDGPRDAPARLRTMRDAIAWSHALLDEADQRFFRRLAVFEGGFELAAAGAVVGASPASELIDRLATLIGQSLVRREDGTGVTARFTMLETVREFAWEQLAVSGEAAELRDAHAQHFLVLAEQSAEDLFADRDVLPRLDQLERERGNLTTALSWTLESADVTDALRLATALVPFWFQHSHLAEGRRWLRQALARAETVETASALRSKAWTGLGLLAIFQQDVAAAVAAIDGGLSLAGVAADANAVAFAQAGAGFLALLRGDVADAIAYGEASQTHFAAVGDKGRAELGQFIVARAVHQRGDLDQAEALYAALRPPGDDVGYRRAGVIHSLALVACARGDGRQAAARFAAALRQFRALGELWNVAACLEGIAEVSAAREPVRATQLFGFAAALRASIGAPRHPFDQAAYDQALAAARRRTNADAFAAAWAGGAALSMGDAVAGAEALATEPETAAPSASRAHLTPREERVLQLIAEGRADKEIAVALGITRRTSSKHVASVLAKLGVPSRAAAAAFAVRTGLA